MRILKRLLFTILFVAFYVCLGAFLKENQIIVKPEWWYLFGAWFIFFFLAGMDLIDS